MKINYGNFFCANCFQSLFFIYICAMDERKIEILHKAAQVYMRYGIRSVTMDDLARELGISKKTIYIYFKDKDEIIKEIINLKIEADKLNCEISRQDSTNAIDEMFEISQFIVETIKNINPSVFYDLQKYHPKAWELLENHKWSFVYSQILNNIQRGIAEGLYRDNMNPELIARMHLAKTNMVFSGELFPIDQYDIEDVFIELFRFQIRGMANEEGLKYLIKRLTKE